MRPREIDTADRRTPPAQKSSMPTGSIYEHYEAEYLACTKRAMENMERIPELLPGVERESLVASTSKAIESAEEVVQQMELEARSASGDAKREGLAQAQDYKVALMNMRTQLKQARASDKANERAREALLEGTDRALRMESEAEHARMAATTTRLQKGTDTIRAACQVAIETEAVGASIMSDLENNRQTIEHARSTLGYANQGLAKSKRLLQGMGRRARCNRVLMVVIIVVLAALIVTIIWLNWFYHPCGAEDNPCSPPPAPPPSPWAPMVEDGTAAPAEAA